MFPAFPDPEVNLGKNSSAIIPSLLLGTKVPLTRRSYEREHPAVPHRDPPGRRRLPAPPARRRPLARRAARRRVDPRRTAWLPEGTGRALAHAVRLALRRGAAQLLPSVR